MSRAAQEQVVRELVMEFLKRVSPKFEAEKVPLGSTPDEH